MTLCPYHSHYCTQLLPRSRWFTVQLISSPCHCILLAIVRVAKWRKQEVILKGSFSRINPDQPHYAIKLFRNQSWVFICFVRPRPQLSPQWPLTRNSLLFCFFSLSIVFCAPFFGLCCSSLQLQFFLLHSCTLGLIYGRIVHKWRTMPCSFN